MKSKSKAGHLAVVVLIFTLVLIAGCSRSDQPRVVVEIVFLPHAPAQAVVEKIEQVLAKKDGVEKRKFSFDEPGGQELAKKYGLESHMPVAIIINGKNSFRIKNRNVVFRNFPLGNDFVPSGMGGNWNYDDLSIVIDQESARRTGSEKDRP